MIIDFLIPIAHAATEAAQHAAPVVNAAAEAAQHAAPVAEAAGHAASAEAGPVALFGVDWKLFIAQLINFGIILFVLWKWVFKPVAKGLADRTAKIEKSLEDATKIAEERETFDSWKNKEMSGVRQEAATIIAKAKEDAEKVGADITAAAKADAEKIMARNAAQLEEEKNKMMSEVKGEIATMVVSAAESILKQKIDSKADQKLIDDALSGINK